MSKYKLMKSMKKTMIIKIIYKALTMIKIYKIMNKMSNNNFKVKIKIMHLTIY